jgi:hypothetical protein
MSEQSYNPPVSDDLDEFADPDDLPAEDVAGDDEESYLDDPAGLWEGDRGSLDAKQRDALVSLLKKAFISSDDRTEWHTLIRDPGPIETNLNNLYFNLVIDQRSEVAYAAPARTADNPFRTLVRDAPNSREETLLLIYLRERFRAATAAGEPHVFADAVAMYEYVQRFRPDSATDKLTDEKRVTNAITGLVTAGLLVKTKDDGRYRVHRAIEALLPLAKLNQLLDAFKRLNSNTDDGAEAPDDFTDSDVEGNRAGTGTTEDYSGRHAAPDNSDAAFAAEQAAAEEAASEQLGSPDETTNTYGQESA